MGYIILYENNIVIYHYLHEYLNLHGKFKIEEYNHLLRIT